MTRMLVKVQAIQPDMSGPAEDDLDRVKRALDEVARKIGRSSVNHLKDMYPDALAAVTKNAEVSLTNHVRNAINYHMRPLLEILVEQSRK
jgi:hypothetical protein